MRLILILVFLANVCVSGSYIFSGAAAGAVSCVVGAVQTVINYFFDRKDRPLPIWLMVIYALSFTVVNLFTFSGVADIFPLLACYAFVLCIAQKNGKNFRVWTLTNAVLWLTYDVVSASYAPILVHAVQTAVVLCGMLIHDRKTKE